MLPEWTVVGFSGHRKVPDLKVATDGIRQALDLLAADYSPLAVASSAASGGDTLFGEEAARRNLPSLVVLPFSRARFQEDFSPEDWARALPLIERAARVEEVAGEESNEAAFMEAGIITADRADLMVFLWNGKPAAGFGGTGDVVAYVRSLGKPLLIIDPVTGRITAERLEQLTKKTLEPGWDENPRERVEQHFHELDRAAEGLAPQSRHLVLRIILLQLIGSAVGFIALAFGVENETAHEVLEVMELVLLGGAFAFSLRHRKSHHEWMRNRIAAEICRSFVATWSLRRADYSPKISIAGFDRFCRNLRLIRTLDKAPLLNLEAVRDHYLRKRVENQIAYFSRQSGRARRIYRRLTVLAFAGTAAAALFALVVLGLSFLHVSGLPLQVPKYLSLVLPLASTAIFSLLITQDHSRRAVRYGEMVVMLEAAAMRLKLTRTWSSLARIAEDTEEKLLQEVVEWHSFRMFVGEPR